MRLLLSTVLLFCLQGPETPLRFEATPAGTQVVAHLSAELAGRLPAGRLTQQQGESVLTLSLVTDNTAGPSMLGKYERTGSELTFMPRFPLGAGDTYRATLKLVKSAALDYRVPKPMAKSPPRVVKIYPSADVLPANHLRFYISFDRPMRGGTAIFKHLVILDDKGKGIEEPWLVDEIWDEANNCLILYIHPGRIKWGVELRQLMGPVLHADRAYTLVVRGEWTDLEGNKIGWDTLKRFRTTPEDRFRIELGDWKVTSPTAGKRDALELALAKSIDYRSLQTGLTVMNAKGQIVAGEIEIGEEEKSWRFTPKAPWQAIPHYLRVSPDLEDVAGNTPSRPFDMDLLAPKRRAQKMQFEFKPR